MLDLEARERERTGIGFLRVGYNRVHGYYIEMARSQADQVPADYQRRQTLKGAERYITPELKEFEDKVLGARDRGLARESELYDGLLASSRRPAGTAGAARRWRGSTCSRIWPSGRRARLLRPHWSTRRASHRAAATRWWSSVDAPFVPNDLECTTTGGCW